MNNLKKLALAPPLILIVFAITLSGWQPRSFTNCELQDTTKKTSKRGTFSRKTIITFDESGEPHEQTIENFDGEESLRKLIVPGQDFDFVIPPNPDIDLQIPGFLKDHSFHVRPDFQFNFDFDSLRDFRFDDGEIEALMQEKFEALGPQFEESMKHLEDQLRHMDMSLNMQWDGLSENMENQLKHLEHDLGDLNLNLRGLDENLKYLDENLKDMNESFKAFEQEAQQELIKDGYLEPGDKIERMEWTDETIKFNNKEIRSEHIEKYRKLKNKHIQHQWQRGRPE